MAWGQHTQLTLTCKPWRKSGPTQRICTSILCVASRLPNRLTSCMYITQHTPARRCLVKDVVWLCPHVNGVYICHLERIQRQGCMDCESCYRGPRTMTSRSSKPRTTGGQVSILAQALAVRSLDPLPVAGLLRLRRPARPSLWCLCSRCLHQMDTFPLA